MKSQQGVCAMCEKLAPLTFHHLIPRSCHSNKWFSKRFTKEEMRSRGVMLCRKCHNFLHKQFTEKELGRELNCIEMILSHEVILKYVGWAKRQR